MCRVTRGRAARWVVSGVMMTGVVAVPVTVLATPVAGAAQPVTTCAGSASVRGSLPFEVARARSGQKIKVTASCPATTPIELTAPLSIDGDLDISGPGAASLVLSGDHSSAVIDVGVSGTLVLSGMTVEDGSAAAGGGIDNGGTLTVDDSTLSGNNASSGGAIDNGGTLTVDDSTFTGQQCRVRRSSSQLRHGRRQRQHVVDQQRHPGGRRRPQRRNTHDGGRHRVGQRRSDGR